jgi:hypothetical protein
MQYIISSKIVETALLEVVKCKVLTSDTSYLLRVCYLLYRLIHRDMLIKLYPALISTCFFGKVLRSTRKYKIYLK